MSRDISQGIDPSMQYLSSAFGGNGVDGTLARMLGQDVKAKAQFCAECGEKTTTAYKPPNAPADSTEVYCQTHYEQMFASRCPTCKEPIMGTFVNANGQKYHQKCYGQEVFCIECQQLILGEALSTLGKNWHPKCFKCNNCHILLGNKFNERGGFPLCDKCITIAPSGVLRSTTTSTVTKSANKDASGMKDFQNNVQKGKLFCAECGQTINDLNAVSFGESFFHETCFTCTTCHTPLAGQSFRNVNNQPFCAKCSGGTTASGGFCGACGQKLVGQYLSAMGQKWHKECFVCTGCRSAFTGGYAEKDGMPYCATCVKKSQPKPTTTTITGERKQGFTIDPRSGKKTFTS